MLRRPLFQAAEPLCRSAGLCPNRQHIAQADVGRGGASVPTERGKICGPWSRPGPVQPAPRDESPEHLFYRGSVLEPVPPVYISEPGYADRAAHGDGFGIRI